MNHQNLSLVKSALQHLAGANSLRPLRRQFRKSDKSTTETGIGKDSNIIANDDDNHQEQPEDEEDGASPTYFSLGKQSHFTPRMREQNNKKRGKKPSPKKISDNGRSGADEDDTETTPQSSSVHSRDDSSHLSSVDTAAVATIKGIGISSIKGEPAYLTFGLDSKHRKTAAASNTSKASALVNNSAKANESVQRTKRERHKIKQHHKGPPVLVEQDGPEEEIAYICGALGMDVHKGFCLRHPNHNVTELSHRYESVHRCLSCALESEANSKQMETHRRTTAEIIQEIHRMRQDPTVGRERTKSQNWKNDAQNSMDSTRPSALNDNAKEEVLAEVEWLEQLVVRVLQVRYWKRLDQTPLSNDPDYARYFRLLRVGVPVDAIKFTVEKDGLDPTVIDLSPDLPLITQRQNAGKGFPSPSSLSSAIDSLSISNSTILDCDSKDFDDDLRIVPEMIERIQIAFNSMRSKETLMVSKAIMEVKKRARRRQQKLNGNWAQKRPSSTRKKSYGNGMASAVNERIQLEKKADMSGHDIPSTNDQEVTLSSDERAAMITDEKDVLIQKLQEELKLKDMEIVSLHEKVQEMEKQRRADDTSSQVGKPDEESCADTSLSVDTPANPGGAETEMDGDLSFSESLPILSLGENKSGTDLAYENEYSTNDASEFAGSEQVEGSNNSSVQSFGNASLGSGVEKAATVNVQGTSGSVAELSFQREEDVDERAAKDARYDHQVDQADKAWSEQYSIENTSDAFGDDYSESLSDEYTSDSSSSCDSDKWANTDDTALVAVETNVGSLATGDISFDSKVDDETEIDMTESTKLGKTATDKDNENRDARSLETGGLCSEVDSDVIEDNVEKAFAPEMIRDSNRQDTLSDVHQESNVEKLSLSPSENANSERDVSGVNSDNDLLPRELDAVKADDDINDENSAAQLPESPPYGSVDCEDTSSSSSSENEEATETRNPSSTNQSEINYGCNNSEDDERKNNADTSEGPKDLEPSSLQALSTPSREDSSVGSSVLDLDEVSKASNDASATGDTTNEGLKGDIMNLHFSESSKSHQERMEAIPDARYSDSSEGSDSRFSSNRKGEGNAPSSLYEAKDENHESVSSYSYSSHNAEYRASTAAEVFDENAKLPSTSTSQVEEGSSSEPSISFDTSTHCNVMDSSDEDDELMMAAALLAREEIEELPYTGESPQLGIESDSDSSYESDSSQSESHVSARDEFASDSRDWTDSFSSYDTYSDADVHSQIRR
jgi:hypothetical protein